MLLKYNIDIDNQIIQQRLQILINQTYKLLPEREQGSEWQKPLETIIIELQGLYSLMNHSYAIVFLTLFNKLEGLYSLTNDSDFLSYRKTIFDCLSLMNTLQKCLQKI